MPKFAEEQKSEQPGLRGPGRVVRDRAPEVAHSGLASGLTSPSLVLAMQRSVGNAGVASYLQRERAGEDDPATSARRSPVHDVVGGGGSPLDPGTRSQMEQSLGGSFGDVRLHVDRTSAESVQAAAFTVGKDIVVHPDHFSPGTPQAQRTLAHELTHVKQQAAGPVAGALREGGVRVSDPSDRFEQEAEHTADAAMSSIAANEVEDGAAT